MPGMATAAVLQVPSCVVCCSAPNIGSPFIFRLDAVRLSLVRTNLCILGHFHVREKKLVMLTSFFAASFYI
jgi:hypothetical protein